MISIKDVRKVIDKRANWIVKEKSGEVLWHIEKPSKKSTIWYSPSLIGSLGYIEVEEFQGKDWADCCLPLPDNEENWIGCLCWFWDTGAIRRKSCGILMNINGDAPFHYQDRKGTFWEHCKPAKPEEIKFYEEK